VDEWRQMKPPLASGGRGLLALALGEAEQGLGELPLTHEVRGLQRRLVALKTVSAGLVRGVPKLTDAQRARFVVDALTLANDVTRTRARLGG
jgi:hypothetical protein